MFQNAVLALIVSMRSGLAQSPDLNELKSRMQTLEQMMKDLQQQIAAAEQRQTVSVRPPVAKELRSEVTPPATPGEYIGDETRLREVGNENSEGAARINNEPMNRTLRGYFRLPGTGTLIKFGGFVKTDVFVDTNQAGSYYGGYVPSSFPSSEQPHTQNATVSMRPSRFSVEFRQPVHAGEGTVKGFLEYDFL